MFFSDKNLRSLLLLKQRSDIEYLFWREEIGKAHRSGLEEKMKNTLIY